MNLIIENSAYATQIQAAYDVAINATNLDSFISELNIQGFESGRGGNHVWMNKDGKRVAIITNLFN